jgi:hypothetical protein
MPPDMPLTQLISALFAPLHRVITVRAVVAFTGHRRAQETQPVRSPHPGYAPVLAAALAALTGLTSVGPDSCAVNA